MAHELAALCVTKAPESPRSDSSDQEEDEALANVYLESPPCAVRVWRPDSGEVVRVLETPNRSTLETLVATRDGSRIVATGPAGVFVWDRASGELKTHAPAAEACVCEGADANSVLVCTRSAVVKQVAPSDEVYADLTAWWEKRGMNTPSAMTFAPAADTLVLADTSGAVVGVRAAECAWHASVAGRVFHLECADRSGTVVAAATFSGMVAVLRASTGDVVWSRKAHQDWVWRVTRLSDSVLASASSDGSVALLRTESGDEVQRWHGHEVFAGAAAALEPESHQRVLSVGRDPPADTLTWRLGSSQPETKLTASESGGIAVAVIALPGHH